MIRSVLVTAGPKYRRVRVWRPDYPDFYSLWPDSFTIQYDVGVSTRLHDRSAAVPSGGSRCWSPGSGWHLILPSITSRIARSFGGMSGVIYGLAGYVWVQGKFNRSAGLYLDSQTMTMLMVWLVVCYSGWIGPIANTAHLSGLIVGTVWGFIAAAVGYAQAGVNDKSPTMNSNLIRPLVRKLHAYVPGEQLQESPDLSSSTRMRIRILRRRRFWKRSSRQWMGAWVAFIPIQVALALREALGQFHGCAAGEHHRRQRLG